MMKLIVDEMPVYSQDCPYCKDQSDNGFGYEDPVCTWNQSGRRCWNPSECPYFTAKQE